MSRTPSERNELVLRHYLRKLRRDRKGTEDERLGTGERVTAIVREEGKEVKPEDMRCEAKKGKTRCKNEKSFNLESGNWRRWCEEHEEQEEKARTKGGPRVERATS